MVMYMNPDSILIDRMKRLPYHEAILLHPIEKASLFLFDNIVKKP